MLHLSPINVHMSDQITSGEVEFEIMHIYVCEEEKFPESSKEMCSSGTTANRRSSSALVSCVQEIAVLNSGVGTGRMASAAYGTGGLYTAVKTIQIRTRLHTLQTQSRGHARMEGDMFRDWEGEMCIFQTLKNSRIKMHSKINDHLLLGTLQV